MTVPDQKTWFVHARTSDSRPGRPATASRRRGQNHGSPTRTHRRDRRPLSHDPPGGHRIDAVPRSRDPDRARRGRRRRRVLVLDIAAGQALATPNALGAAVFRGLAFDLDTPITAINVFGYTLLHSSLFIIAATGAITVEYTLTERGVPLATQCIGGAVLLFGALHTSILTLMLLVDAPLDSTLGPARLLAINAIAAGAMATATYAVARRRLARRRDD